MKIAKDKAKLVLWTLFLLIGMGRCAAQQHVVDYSFTFMDKWGLVIGYDIQYITKSKSPLDNVQKEKLFFQTSKIASAYGREVQLTDFYFKRDSIEKVFINDVIEQARKDHIKIKEIKIIYLIVPKQIADAIILRARSFKEPQPTRIKSYDE